MANREILNNTIDLNNKYPVDDMAISINQDGRVLSKFSDDYWNLSNFVRGYSTNPNLDFSEEGTGLNKETLIHLRLIILYILFYENGRKDILSFTVIREKYRIYKVLAQFFKGKKSSFLNLKTNGIAQKKYLEKLSLNSQNTLRIYIGAFNTINNAASFFDLGEDFGMDEALIGKVQKIQSLAVATINQTILIPSRIYSEFINKSSNAFEVMGDNLDNLEIFFKDQYFTIPKNIGRQTENFLKIIDTYGLLPYCNYFNIKTLSDFFNIFQHIQNLGVLVIGCFSGMRKTEILNLSQNCLQQKIVNGKEVYLLNGYTSKTSKVGTKKAVWITSKSIVNVIDTLKRFHKIIKIINDHYGLYQDVEIEEYPLLANITKYHGNKLTGNHRLYKHPPSLLNGLDKTVKILCNIEIIENDVDELISFNPLINWTEEYSLKVGKFWNFRTHQFRRSLVVYGIRSGVVKLAVLKKQLQHLTVDMTSYYGNSSGSASNLFDTDLVDEFKEENIRFQFVQYQDKVINNDDTLFGGEGTRLHLSKKMEQVPEYLSDKQKTLQYFQDGRLSYKRTPLGGCSKVGACDKLGFSYITACIDCKDSIFDSSSKVALNKTKQAYVARLSKYEPDSITYKQLQIEINSIDRILNKVEILEIRDV